MLITAVLLLLVGAVLLVLRWRKATDSGAATAAGLVSVGLGLLAGLATVVHVVAPYEVGVPTTLGKVGGTWQPGLHLKSPLTDVSTFSTRPVDLDLTGKDTVEVRSSEGGVLYADITVKWSVDPKHTQSLFKLAGDTDAVQKRLVYPDSREIVRNVFAKHTGVEGYSSEREAISAEIERLVTARLAPRGILVNGVNLRNVKPSDSLQHAIDQKIQQDQATAQAEAAVRTAKAEAEKRKIESESTAAANTAIANSLTDKILMSQCIEAFKAAAEKNPVYASPCGTGGSPVIVDGTKR
ncbi:prohibitin family protein [Streptomyces sp. NRRL B-24484]|uniref:prohibitin family protein n=1 Tax=Streptomyces sp. NRRL B-24484 TaxID=1463833 RepID=UPI0004BE4BF8|nr:prohibitin family protein [Streptomyces sp. NRRL B-24484]